MKKKKKKVRKKSKKSVDSFGIVKEKITDALSVTKKALIWIIDTIKKYRRMERKKYWLKGFFWGWSIFIVLFFSFLLLSDYFLFFLLYPGWFILDITGGRESNFIGFFGSFFVAVIFISFLFYCMLGALIGYTIERIQHRAKTVKNKSKKGKSIIQRMIGLWTRKK